MDRGERINLITATAAKLAELPQTDSELMLDTFGIPPITGSWHSDYDYFVARLRNGDDDDLVALHAHVIGVAALGPSDDQAGLNGSLAVVRQDDVGDPWAGGMFRLFLSHVSARKDAVGQLREGLRPFNIDAFVAHEDIDPGSEWRRVIRKGLGTCDACAAVLSDGWRESDWCDQEVGYCLGRGVLVIPLKETHDPYGFIGDYQAFSLVRYDKMPELCAALHELLHKHELTREAMAAVDVLAFEQSPSFNAARHRWEQLLAVPAGAWTPALLTRVRDAHEINGELSAWYGSSTVAGEAVSLAATVAAARGFQLPS